MSGDLQARKRKGKGKKKDEFDDEILEAKNNNKVANGNHRGQSDGVGGSGGEGSGVVAKVVFLLLLLTLSAVVALILVELQGKKAGMKDTGSVVPEPVGEIPEAPPAPDVPPPVIEESLPVPSLPPPVLQQAEVEEYEPLEATPPLEEYIKVVQEAPEVVQEVVKIPRVVEEVVEVPEVVKVVEKVEAPIMEEVVEKPQVVKIVAEIETPVNEVVKEPKINDGDASTVEEVVVVIEETPVVEVVEVVEVVKKEEVHVEKVVEVVEVVEEVKEAAAPVVEEETAKEIEAPVVKEFAAPVVKEDTAPVVEKVVKETVIPQVEDVPTEVQEDEVASKEEVEEDEEDEEAEASEASRVVAEEEDEEDWSQYGKEGSTKALTEAYLGVESLAAEILAVDPTNPMMAQLTPHLSEVLRAMEEGQTEGLLDTLKHIEVILEDVKKRIDEKLPIIMSKEEDTPETEANTESQPLVDEAQEVEEETEKEAESVFPPKAEVEQSEPVAVPEQVPEAKTLETESQNVSEPEPEVEAEVEEEEEERQAQEKEEEEEEKQQQLEKEDEEVEKGEGETLQVSAESVPESVVADIEAQVIPHEVAAEEEHSQVFPPEVEVDLVSPPAEGENPTPVEEVIPDPIHIEPLQDPLEKKTMDDAQSPVYKKADITSGLDDTLREELDTAEKLQARGP